MCTTTTGARRPRRDLLVYGSTSTRPSCLYHDSGTTTSASSRLRIKKSFLTDSSCCFFNVARGYRSLDDTSGRSGGSCKREAECYHR